MTKSGFGDRFRPFVFHVQEFVHCTTPRKLANLLLLKLQRWLRRDRLVGMPAYYFIDPINICNLRCPLCPTGQGILARPRGRMPLSELKRIVDEIAPYAYRLELYNWGEPLLHPEIFEMVEYASRKRISVRLSSNLNLLDEGSAQRLVQSGLSQLVVSIDGATQETYAAYRQRGHLDVVLRNLQLLLDAKRGLGTRRPFILWRMLVGKHNEHEVATVRRMAQQSGVDSFSTSMLFVDTHDRAQVEKWLPTDASYSGYNHSQEALENTWDCHELWEGMVINWDGGVAPCCWLHDAQFDFDNVTQHSVRAIWNSPPYVSARRVIGLGKQHSDDIKTICHRCRGHPRYMAY